MTGWETKSVKIDLNPVDKKQAKKEAEKYMDDWLKRYYSNVGKLLLRKLKKRSEA